MSFWEFFWNANQTGLSAFGWLIIVITIMAALLFLAGFVIWLIAKKFIVPHIKEAFDKIDKLFDLFEAHDERIRDVEETIRAHEKAQEVLEANLQRQVSVSEQMIKASERIVANMEITCFKWQEIVDVLGNKVNFLTKELEDLKREHDIRHAGEVLKAVKPKSK